MKIADYEDALIADQVIKKRNKLIYLQNLIYNIQSIPANELKEKWDSEARQLLQKGLFRVYGDNSSLELGKKANRAFLQEIENEWEVV